MIAIFLNLTVIALLAITIIYAIRVNSKLNLLKNQKHDFAMNIQAFNDATEAAIIAVEELHIKGEEICKLIDQKITKGQLMSDEIEFIMNRASKQLIGMKALAGKPQEAPKAHGVNSIAEAQLLKALRDREFKEALAN